MKLGCVIAGALCYIKYLQVKWKNQGISRGLRSIRKCKPQPKDSQKRSLMLRCPGLENLLKFLNSCSNTSVIAEKGIQNCSEERFTDLGLSAAFSAGV